MFVFLKVPLSRDKKRRETFDGENLKTGYIEYSALTAICELFNSQGKLIFVGIGKPATYYYRSEFTLKDSVNEAIMNAIQFIPPIKYKEVFRIENWWE